MNKKLLVLLVCLIACISMKAEKISEEEAIAKARSVMPHKKFMSYESFLKKKKILKPQKALSKEFYVINAEDGGFVIVAADDRIPDVLGYSEKGNLDISNLPSNVKWLLDSYQEIIQDIEDGNGIIYTTYDTKPEVAPMITTSWGQGSPYNRLCPTFGGQCLTGCVATAMAQVINYWKWPIDETNSVSAYSTSTNKIYMPELQPTTFDWDDMTNNNIAKLMLYCGQSVEMDYGVEASGASDIDIPDAMYTVFGYASSTHRVLRSSYGDEAWESLIYDEIQSGRPVLYSGVSGSNGHMFVCCGYNEGKFYINWGWDGDYDGYYDLTLLNPSSYSYTQNQTAIVGIQKPIYNELDEEDRMVIYGDPESHLTYTLHMDTQEATLGTEDTDENTRFAAKSWVGIEDGDLTNYWEHVNVPASINYRGKEYTVTRIGPMAFYRTTEVHAVKLPETIRAIGADAFNTCVNLESINIPSQVQKIEAYTFNFCHFNLNSIQLPKNIKTIGVGAFMNCRNLEEINIPGNCEIIREEAFTGCEKLKRVIIEDGIKELEIKYSWELPGYYQGQDEPKFRGIFGDCPLSYIYLGRNIKCPVIGNQTYSPFYIISNYLTATGGAQLRDGQSFSVEFGDYVTSIPDYMFYDCVFYNKLVLPPNLKTIGESSFAKIGHNKIAQYDITFPNSLESIGEGAFSEWSDLKFIHCMATTPPVLSGNPFWKANLVIIVPEGSGNQYREDEYWGQMRINDPADAVVTINVRTAGTLYSRLLAQDIQANDVYKLKLKGFLNDDDWSIIKSMSQLYDIDLSELQDETLPSEMFKQNNRLSNIKLPANLKRIEDYAFSECYHLAGNITIPASCTEIGQKAFYSTAIESLSCPQSISIGEAAFNMCWNLKIPEITFSGDGTTIATSAFGDLILNYFNVTEIGKVSIGKGVSISNGAFGSHVNELVIEEGVESIGADAFEADVITFNGTVKHLEENAFRGCGKVCTSSLDVWLRQSFPSIMTNPTYYSHNLYVGGQEVNNIKVPSNISKITDYAFVNVESIENVELNANIKSLGNGAFLGCTNLKSIDFATNSALKSIGSSTFSECSSISTVDFPTSITSIGEKAFENCSSLNRVVAHWDEPFTINSNTFSGINENCYLYVPIGKATAYVNTGWNLVPNFKEAGILSIKANSGGTVSCYDTNITDKMEDVFFTPYKSFYVNFTPNEGHVIKKIKLNGEIITSQLENGMLYIEEPEENMTLSVLFADTSIQTGDVNGDGVINVTDAICVVNYILKNKPKGFKDFSADVNDDDVINVTDAIVIIKELLHK